MKISNWLLLFTIVFCGCNTNQKKEKECTIVKYSQPINYDFIYGKGIEFNSTASQIKNKFEGKYWLSADNEPYSDSIDYSNFSLFVKLDTVNKNVGDVTTIYEYVFNLDTLDEIRTKLWFSIDDSIRVNNFLNENQLSFLTICKENKKCYKLYTDKNVITFSKKSLALVNKKTAIGYEISVMPECYSK